MYVTKEPKEPEYGRCFDYEKNKITIFPIRWAKKPDYDRGKVNGSIHPSVLRNGGKRRMVKQVILKGGKTRYDEDPNKKPRKLRQSRQLVETTAPSKSNKRK